MKPLSLKFLFAGLGVAFSMGFAQESQARYETCYEQEYRCETRYEQQCSHQQQCHTVPGHQECRQVRLCTPRPSQPNCRQVTECGTNALGQEICKTREVCEGSTGGGEDCGYVQECSQTPSRQECTTVPSCHQVPTQDCGYHTVAKQCYVPDPIPTPIPQPQPPIYHPPAPQPPPIYHPEPEPIYPEPEPIYPQPEPIYPEPQPQPQPQPQPEPVVPGEMGSNSVTGLKLSIDSKRTGIVSFTDKGQGVTYRTRYFITILDRSGVVIINQHASSDGQRQQRIELSQQLSPREDHTLIVRVLRTGGSLVKDVSFVKTVSVPAKN